MRALGSLAGTGTICPAWYGHSSTGVPRRSRTMWMYALPPTAAYTARSVQNSRCECIAFGLASRRDSGELPISSPSAL